MNSILNHIKAETAEMISRQARALGLSVDDYLRMLLPSANDLDPDRPLYETASLEEWTTAFREWASGHATLPNIADDSRESIYEGRGE